MNWHPRHSLCVVFNRVPGVGLAISASPSGFSGEAGATSESLSGTRPSCPLTTEAVARCEEPDEKRAGLDLDRQSTSCTRGKAAERRRPEYAAAARSRMRPMGASCVARSRAGGAGSPRHAPYATMRRRVFLTHTLAGSARSLGDASSHPSLGQTYVAFPSPLFKAQSERFLSNSAERYRTRCSGPRICVSCSAARAALAPNAALSFARTERGLPRVPLIVRCVG